MARRFLPAIPLAIPVAFANLFAQSPGLGRNTATPLSDYALTNVRIVTAPGKVIERGTIVTRDGRIVAVGAQVNIPADVVRMDLTGHTVFPGLIDAATSIGLPSPSRPLPAATNASAAEGGRGGRGGGRAAGPGVPAAGRGPGAPLPPVVEPEVDANAEASDMFAPTTEELKALRAGGVTAVGLVFTDEGLFPGRVGAALTGARNDIRFGLRSAVGQEVTFGHKRGGAYPATGIGAFAFIRQSFLDAQYEARLDKAFRAGTPGARPSNDPFNRALMPAAVNEMPAWFVASTEREMARVFEISKEIGFKSPVVVGAQEGWRAVRGLKQSMATAVVSLAWPSVDSVTGREFGKIGAGRGAAGTSDAEVTAQIKANAVALAKAGVPVVFASYGGTSGATFRDRIRSTIEAGMSPDDALRAATVTPAALLGITAAVGTIEVGKLANLVVVSGNDLFASGTPIKHVFVEGRLY